MSSFVQAGTGSMNMPNITVYSQQTYMYMEIEHMQRIDTVCNCQLQLWAARLV